MVKFARLLVVVAVVAVVFAAVPVLFAPAEAGQSEGGTKRRPQCWTWGSVVNVQLAVEMGYVVPRPVIYLTLRDWSPQIQWFEYYWVRVADSKKTPLDMVQSQATAAIGQANLAVQIHTPGTCGGALYSPDEFSVYDVTPVEADPPEEPEPSTPGGGKG